MPGKFLFCACKKQLLLLFAATSFLYSFAQNPIVIENASSGNPESEWDISGAGSSSIQGFGTDISVNKGERINFKINTNSAFTYTIKIYRLGYYQGSGAKLKADLGTYTGTVQPQPFSNSNTGIVDCGNWSVSAFWDVPATAVSGVYIAKLARTSNPATSSHIVFIVRDDASHSDLFFQTSDATWQAYNDYGGNSLYVGATTNPTGHASKVSYNRPFNTRAGSPEDWLFNAEYPMIRFIERNGYDMTYTTNVDAARRGNLILNHKIFLSVGHDEYWSGQARNNVEAARSAGINLCFFSGNEVYWKTRWENSVDGTNTSYRTLVCYKEGTDGEYTCGNKCDPTSEWTGLWRSGCQYSNGGGCKPENALTGQISWTETNAAIKVTADYKNLPFWRNTAVASLTGSQSVTLTNGMLGYEWDPENSQYQSSYPANRVILSSTSTGGLVHKLSMYTHASGAKVFGAGTCQWSWGLDSEHDRGSAAANIIAQQATVNLFGDMGAQPGSIMAGLIATATTPDVTAPSTTIASPLHGATLPINVPVTITGTASDVGGAVSKVEVSLNGGSTWQLATGTINWTFAWTPTTGGSVNIRVRGTDNSNNVEVPGAAGTADNINVTISTVVDNTAPVTIISSPINGASMPAGTALNITGTSGDVGGVVSLIEVSVNGGSTWQSATGTTNWTFSWTPSTTGSVNIRARARDNSGNQEVPGALGSANNITVTVTTPPIVSGTIFQPTDIPSIPLENDGQAIELGVKFRTSVNGYILGIRFYKGTGTTGTHSGSLWSSTGTKLATANFVNETASGWQQVLFTTPVAINANTTYVASYFSSSGDYCSTNPFFTTAVVNGPVTALASGTDGTNGLYRYTTASAFPNSNWQTSNYYADVVFTTSISSVAAPTVTTQPASQTKCVGANATFTSAANGTPTPTVKWQVNNSGTWSDISGATSATLTFVVSADDNNKQYRAVWTNSEGTINSNAATLTVNNIPSTPTVSVINNCGSSILTAADFAGTLLWSNSATSTSITVSNAATYTVTQTVNGCVSAAGSGVSAPKAVPGTPTITVANNCGSSTLTANNVTGALLWSNGETTSPIIVTAAGPYTLTQTVGECTSNAASATAAPKAIPGAPSVTVTNNCGSSTLSAGNYTGTLLWSTGAATSSITVGTANTYTVTQTVNGCVSAAGSGVAEPVISDAPAPAVEVENNCGSSTLTANNYTGSLVWSTGATTPSITVTAAGTYTVTQTVNGCPSGPGSGVAAPLNSSVATPTVGVVNNCGTSILTAGNYTGDLLWSTGETSPSITVFNAATYTVSQTVNGCSSAAGSGVATPGDPLATIPVISANGSLNLCQGGSVTLTSSLLTGNLWSTGATTRSITVSATGNYSVINTGSGSCNIASIPVSVIVNPIPAGTISSPTGTICESETASVVFNASSGTGLYNVVINGTTYPNVSNGSTIVTGSGGSSGTNTSLWDNTTVPSTPLENDGQAVEVGMKFRVSVSGVVKSIRFYKGSNNDASTYTLKIYQNSSRALLASVTYSNTTATGWQTVDLPAPLALTVGTTYVVSCYSPSGNYSNNLNYFSTARTNGPLTGLANGTDGNNGVYKYGTAGFPTSSYRSSNYWVDVVFSTATNVTLNLTSITDVNTNCSVSGNLGTVTLQVVQCTLTRSSGTQQPLGEVENNIPLKPQLDQNTPNPFNGSTLVRFGIPSAGKVRLTLFDLNGRPVQVLLDETKDAGFYTIPVQRKGLGTGIYYYKLETGGETLIKKMTIL